jgi:ABC-type Fe3+/spermidine/putrescine transport system ATPase subunit
MGLELRKIKKTYPDFIIDLSFQASTGEILTLLGPSGCGKTTTLHIIAGFIMPDSGHILLNEADMTNIPPHRRSVGLVFQDYALFPHMSVFGNVSFGLRMQGWGKKKAEQRVKDLLSLVQLHGYERRIVTGLSGGEQQRVALARALAPEPEILLLDEPLSALDARLRKELRGEIKRIQRELGITTVYVTHDQEEALALSDHIAVMNDGRVAQTGTPYDIYMRPEHPFVADFVGTTNTISARVRGRDGDLLVLSSQEGELRVRCETDHTRGREVTLYVRPEHFRVNGPDAKNSISGRITNCEYLGDTTVVTLQSAHAQYSAKLFGTAHCSTGQTVRITFSPEDCWIIPSDEPELDAEG